MAQDNQHRQSGVGVKDKPQLPLEPPRRYRVIMLNDDVTTVDFVIAVLEQVFRKDRQEAEALTLHIHTTGQGVVGVYSYDIAITLKQKAVSMARINGFPLQLRVMPDED